MAKKTYLDVMQQIKQLQAEAESLKRREIEAVVSRIREAIDVYELTPEDLFGTGPRRGTKQASSSGAGTARKQSARAVQYSDGQGNTWGGRGPRPRWLREALSQGASLESFRVGGTPGKTRGRKAAVPAPVTAAPARKARRTSTAQRSGAKTKRAGGRKGPAAKNSTPPTQTSATSSPVPEQQ